MSRIHGRKGRLYVGLASDTAVAEPVAYLSSWSISFETDKTDVTAFGDANKTYVAGLPDSTGEFGGFYDTATVQLYTAARDGLARKFYLYPDNTNTGQYFWGTAFYDFSVEADVGDAVKVSGSWNAATDIIKVG